MEDVSNVISVTVGITAILASLAAILLYRTRTKLEKETQGIREQQKQILQQMSEFSHQAITQSLKVLPQTAFAPYHQFLTPPIPSGMSLFDDRRSHFTPEKEIIAERIVDIVQERIEEGTGGNALSIILVLDSGSSVFPIFRQLCTHPTFQFNIENAKRLKIVTNNLPGVSDLIKHGRIGPPTRARTLFRCRILSGFAHSQYEASLSSHTVTDLSAAIKEFRQKIQEERSGDKIRVISVITGNYVSVKDGPLARDPDHVATKSAMIQEADETFVLAPLGKMLPYPGDIINELLKLDDPEEEYRPLASWNDESQRKKVTLVVTKRAPDYFCQIKPSELGVHFGRVQANIRETFDESHLIMISFDPSADIQVRTQASIMGLDRTLREYELPHRNLRESLIEKLHQEK